MYAKIFNVLPGKEYMILIFVEIILLQYMNYISIKLLQKYLSKNNYKNIF